MAVIQVLPPDFLCSFCQSRSSEAGLVSDTREQKASPGGSVKAVSTPQGRLQPPEVTAGRPSLVKSPSTRRAPAWLSLQTQVPSRARAALQVPCFPRKGLRGLLPSSSQPDSPDSQEQKTSKPHLLSAEKPLGGRKATNTGSSFWQSQHQAAEVSTSRQGSSASCGRQTALLWGCRLAWLRQALLRNASAGYSEILREQKAKTHLLTSTQKSPRIVPGLDSAGLVSPIIVRTVLTTSRPCQTYVTAKQESASQQILSPVL